MTTITSGSTNHRNCGLLETAGHKLGHDFPLRVWKKQGVGTCGACAFSLDEEGSLTSQKFHFVNTCEYLQLGPSAPRRDVAPHTAADLRCHAASIVQQCSTKAASLAASLARNAVLMEADLMDERLRA